MQDQNLFFNIVTFNWPTKKANFYFVAETKDAKVSKDRSLLREREFK